MSVSSNTSTIISFRGDDEVDLDTALRTIWRDAAAIELLSVCYQAISSLS
jgi:hypothetical protein